MRNVKKRLQEKGWNRKDINKTAKIMAKAKKHPRIRILDRSVYWISLFLAIVGNLIVSVSLIPFLLALKSLQLYLIIITMGIVFGLLFELLVRTIEHLETKHHLFLGIIIPITALINVFLIVSYSNNLEKILNIDNNQDPLMVGIVYAIAFILPFAIYHFFLKNRE